MSFAIARGPALLLVLRSAIGATLTLLFPRLALSLPVFEPDPSWPETGATLAARLYVPGSLRAIPDGEGGAIAAWQDARKLPPGSCNCRNVDDLYAQRVSPDGRTLWAWGGLPVCTWTGIWGGADLLVGLIGPSPGSALIYWYHLDGPMGTFASLVSPSGKLEWGTDGATVYVAAGVGWKRRSLETGKGETWLGLDGDRERELGLGRCVLKRGVLTCTTPAVLAVEGEVETAMLAGGRKGRGVFAVYSSRTPKGGMTLRVISLDRGFRTAIQGPVLAGTPVAPIFFDCVPDGAGGVYVVWIAGEAGAVKITAQRLDEKGGPLWGSGAPLGTVSAPVPVAAAVRSLTGVLAAVDFLGIARPASLAAGWVEDGRLRVRLLSRSGKPAGPPDGAVLGARIVPGRRFIVAPCREHWIAGWVESGNNSEAVMVAPIGWNGAAGTTSTVFQESGILADLEGVVEGRDGSIFVFWADSGGTGSPSVLRVRRFLAKGR